MLKSLVSESAVAGKMTVQLQIHGVRGETSVSYLPVEDASAESTREPMAELLRKKRRVGTGGGGGGVGGGVGGAMRRRRRMTTTTTMSSSWVSDCCPAGCLAGFVGCVYFFLIVPTGVLLTWHGHSTEQTLTFGLGISVLIVSTFVVPGILIAIRYCHKMRSNRMISSLNLSDTSSLEAGVEKMDMRILTPNSPAVHPSDTVS